MGLGGTFQHLLGQNRLPVVILVTHPPFTPVLMLQVQPISRRNPSCSVSSRTSGKLPYTNPSPHNIYLHGVSSPAPCLSLPGDKCPRFPFTSRCAERLSEIKPLYSKVNDACFAAQSLCLLSTVPITECRCHTRCNSIVLKGFRPPFFERVIFFSQ